jgi:multidrug efflux pump subunit AcrB
MEVLPAVFVSVLTTIIAFIPFFYIDGRMGEFIWHMAAIIIISLAFSLVESILILPSHIKHSLESGRRAGKIRQFISGFLQKFMFSAFFKPIRLSLKNPMVTISLGITIAIVTLGLSNRYLYSNWFPSIDSDFIVCNLEMEPGTPESKTAEVVEELKAALTRIEKNYAKDLGGHKLVMKVHATLGGTGAKKSSEHAEVAVQMLKAEERKDILIKGKIPLVAEFMYKEWRKEAGKINGVRNISFGRFGGHTFGAPITVQINGRDLDEIKEASTLVIDYLKNENGVQGIQVERHSGKDELVFTLTEKGRAMGLTRRDIAFQVRQAFYGTEILELQRGRDSVEVWARYADTNRTSFDDIHALRIRLADDREIPFDEVAEYVQQPGISKIVREDRRRLMQVTAEIDDKVANAKIIKDAMVENLFGEVEALYPGIKLRLSGQDEERRKSSTSMRLAFPVALVFMVIAISLMFKSYIQGVMVLTMIPFGLTGAVVGHIILDIQWTILSTIGVIGLSGIVVNDSVVLIDAINRFRKNGMSIYDASLAGAKGRIRPILLTSITTFASISPLLFEKSFQAQFLVPIAVTIAFGLLSATFYTLFFIPSYYYIIETFLKKWKEVRAMSMNEFFSGFGRRSTSN